MSEKINNGGQAFPFVQWRSPDGMLGIAQEGGMTLRDYFAGQVLAGLMANSGGPIQPNPMSGWGYTNCDPDDVAREAYGLADAMLAARAGGRHP